MNLIMSHWKEMNCATITVWFIVKSWSFKTSLGVRTQMESNPVSSHVNTRPALGYLSHKRSVPSTAPATFMRISVITTDTTAAFPQQQPAVIEQHYATTPSELSSSQSLQQVKTVNHRKNMGFLIM
uniref:Uncharacterized protein n=1 Tax=Oryza punctata TaxID=4537 RepID=A0A0E0LWC8_ORYPU